MEGRAAAGSEVDGTHAKGLHAREDGSNAVGGEGKHVPRERGGEGEGERGRGGVGEGVDAPPACHAAASDTSSAQREEEEWDFGRYGDFVKVMMPKIREAGKGVYVCRHVEGYICM